MNTSVSTLSKFFDAIEHGSVGLKYLPVIELVEGVAHIHGIYCQIHWPHYETINIDSMFRLIEKNGLGTIVDQYFADIALEEIATSKTLSTRDDRVFISAYMDSFNNSKFLEHIVQRANELKFDLSRLVISVQEHYPNEQSTQHIELIQHAMKYGIQFCGVLGKQSSTRTELILGNEFSFLRIDSALVQEVGTNSRIEKYLHNYYDTAHNLQKTVVACGIDNEHTFIAMRANG
ncbi:MAG: EAL domain-containing protein [Idiomarina sp.]|nr:EAL domain-containing protein [Idiomarina sp.]